MAEFKRDRTSCQDEHRNGRPNEVTTTEMVKKIHKMVLDDRRLKVSEIADMVEISRSGIHRILTENLDMKKLCARWINEKWIHHFTPETKEQLKQWAGIGESTPKKA